MKKFMQTFLVYAIPSFISPLVQLISIPIFANSLSLEAYGTYELQLALSVYLSVTLTFGMDAAMGRYLADIKPYDNKHLIKMCLRIPILLYIAVIIAYSSLYVVQRHFTAPNFLYQSTDSTIISLLLLIALVVGYNFIRNYFKWMLMRWMYTVISLAQPVSLLIITYFSIGRIEQATDIFHIMILSYTLPSIVLFLYFALNNRTQKEENNHILVRLRFGELLSFAAPIGILGVVIGATKFVDKMFVGYYLGLSDLAIYAVTMKFSLIIYNLDIAFAAVWGPTFLKKYLANQDADHVKQIFTTYLAAIILIIIGIITISGAILELFFPPSYSQSLDLLPYFLFAAGLQSCSANLSNIYDICKKTKFHLYFGLGNLILFLLLLTFLVPAIGLMGVGIAAVITALVDAALRIIFAWNLLLGWVDFPPVIGYFFVLGFGTIILPQLTNDVMLINSGIVLFLVWHQTKKYFL